MANGAEGKGTCLIAGCGYTGTRLARRLEGTGPVLALVRGAASAAALRVLGIPAVAIDFDQEVPPGFLDLPTELASVVYLAPPQGVGQIRSAGAVIGHVEAQGVALHPQGEVDHALAIHRGHGVVHKVDEGPLHHVTCLLYTSPSPRD